MVGVQASKTVLKISYQSFLIYLEIKSAVVGTTTMGRLAPKSPVGLLDNLLSNFKGGEESKRVTEEHYLRGRL